MSERPHGAGKNSFGLVDSDLLFSEMALKEGTAFLDIACGFGTYSLAASKFIGSSGKVYAFDLWEQGIHALKKEARDTGATNIEARVADVSKHIPVGDQSVDIALMAMVLHDLMRNRSEAGALAEIRRVVNHEGRLCVIEFKKKDGPPGPPIDIRLSPKTLENLLLPHGFRAFKSLELGPDSYLMMFTLV